MTLHLHPPNPKSLVTSMLSVAPEPRAPRSDHPRHGYWRCQVEVQDHWPSLWWQKTPNLQHSFFFLDNGLQARSPAWIMQKQLQLWHKRSTDGIKHDMIKKEKEKKENKDVALTLACIIFTVKTMTLTCKEEYSFFVKNKIQTTNLLYCLCQCVYDQLLFFFL